MEIDGETFLAPLQRRLVECKPPDDATAIKTADALLRGGDHSTASELQRLAGVLIGYGCELEAGRLTHRASRLRAAQFLRDSIGYERPTESV